MITIDQSTATPPFEQIRTQLREQILSGQLLSGTQLPTVRKLAGDLGLSTNTVARSYKELESAGLVRTRGRAGTVVSADDDFVRAESHAAATDFATRMKELGVSWDEAQALVRSAFAVG